MPRPSLVCRTSRASIASVAALLVAAFLLLPHAALAAGTIAGTVKDSKTGEPIAFANVLLKGTTQGANTKVDGTFQIDGVAPGTQILEIKIIGYETKTQTLTVADGGKAQATIVLNEVDVAVLDAIEVKGSKEKIDVESSSSSTKIDTKYQFKHRAINTVQDALSKEAGVVNQDGQLHVRGGRANETKYLVDGLPVSDPFVGTNSLQVSFAALSEVNLLSGGFDAEYGEAQSGIVNLATAEGGTKFSGLVKFMTDDFGAPDKTYYNTDNIVLGMGGPLMGNDLRWYLSGEGVFSDTYLPLDRPKPKREVLGVTLSDRQNNRYQYQGKLSYLIGGRADKKITAEGLYSRDEFQSYFHAFSRVGYWSQEESQWWFEPLDSTYTFYRGPEHLPNVESRNRTFKSVWTHSISPLTFYSVRASLYRTNQSLIVGGKQPFEYDSFNRVEDIDPSNDYFAVSGDYPQWQNYTTKRWTGKSDLTSQVTSIHKLKTGLQLDYYDLNMFDAIFPSADEPDGFFHDIYQVYAWGGSAYVQDRLKYEGMIVNAGLRYDWFDPGVRATRIGNAGLASRFFAPGDVSFAERVKTQISPRIGMAYPITDRDVLHFHYGRFFQLPNLEFLYSYLGQPIDQANTVVGNVFLEPENTISYELGVDHQLSDNLTIDVTVFFKDIYGLIGTSEQTQGSNSAAGAQAATSYVNKDYGSVRGLEFKIDRPLTNKLGATLVYTLSRAAGVSSDVNQGYLIGLGRQDREPIREQPLDWDRTHSLTANLILSDPGVWEVSTDWTYLTGAPFTPQRFNERRTNADVINSLRIAPTSQVDVRANKLYTIYGREFRLFADGSNILDRGNIRSLEPGFWPTNDPLYAVYYTESGGLGGAYSLSSVSATAEHELVPLGDPRVYDPGRSVKVGVLVDW
ncbi:MAG: TonB-dependent receptor [bacterium]